MRSTLIPLVAAVLMVAVALPALAQETADISLGGGLVARLRDRGAFATIAERAANVDQKIVQIVSEKDTQHPQVTVKQRGNLWTVYAWDVPVLSVYPAEAAVNKMGEKQLADVWARNLQAQLPKATPCSKLPPEQLGYAAAPGGTAPVTTASTGPVAAKPATARPPAKVTTTTKPPATTPVKPATTATTKPVTTTKPPVTKPVTAVSKPPVAAAATQPASTMVGNEAGALLLIVAAMGTARDLNDQDWAGRKEAVARELYGSLSYYLTGKGTPPKPATTTTTKPATTTATTTKPPVTKPVTATTKPPVTKPVTTTTKPPVTKPVTTTTKPPVTKPVTTATKPPVTATTTKPPTTAATTTTAAATDPTMVKVPQKNRIRAKFAAAKPAYDQLAQTDPEAAKKVSAMLAASRQAFAYGKFDESEQKVDEALAALGVEFKE